MRLLELVGIVSLAAFSCGCVAHGALKRDLYSKGIEAVERSSVRVVVVRQPGPPARLRHRELPWTSVEIDLSGYPRAVAAMLSSLYGQVAVATTTAETQGGDFIVLLSTDYPRTVGLTFQDASGKTLASFSRPGMEVPDNPDADSLLAKMLTPPGAVVSFGTLGIGFMYRAMQSRDQISADLSSATAKALGELRVLIAAAAVLSPGSGRSPAAACSAVLSDAQASPATHLSCAKAAEDARSWREAAAHLKAYLAMQPNAPDAAQLRLLIGDLESRPN